MERPSNEYLLERFGRVAGATASVYVSRNPHFAQDLMSEADLAIFVAAGEFDWSESEDCYGFAALVKVKVRKLCLEFLAKMAYSSTGSARSLTNHKHFHASAHPDSVDYQMGFEWDASSDAEDLDLIREAAGEVLTDRQFEAFARFYFDGICSDTYVAEMMGINQSNATRLRERAEERIKDFLQ